MKIKSLKCVQLQCIAAQCTVKRVHLLFIAHCGGSVVCTVQCAIPIVQCAFCNGNMCIDAYIRAPASKSLLQRPSKPSSCQENV